MVENILPDVLDDLKNDWFIRADPDEVYSAELLANIAKCIEGNPSAAIVKIPFQYYFFGNPLTTTVWGGIRYFPKVLNKRHVTIRKQVHMGPEVENGYQIVQVSHDDMNAVKHYWVTSWRQLYEKHWRYLQLEGRSQYDSGERFSWLKLMQSVVKALAFNLIKYNGWRGGFAGIFLSFFHTWYVGMSWLSLRQYQKRISADK